MRNAITSLLLLSLFLAAGCYETPFALGRAEDAKVDKSLLGQWTFDSLGEAADEKAVLTVTDLDGHRYALEWKTLADGKVMKMHGFVAEVKKAKFVHAAPLDMFGKPSKKHWLIRFDLDSTGALAVSHLDPEFLASRNVTSDATLRSALETSIDDPALYLPDVLLGKRPVTK